MLGRDSGIARLSSRARLVAAFSDVIWGSVDEAQGRRQRSVRMSTSARVANVRRRYEKRVLERETGIEPRDPVLGRTIRRESGAAPLIP